MKTLFALFLISSIALQSKAQLKVFEGSWKDAFSEAQKEDKYLFIDCYTDWCTWCKVADKTTFAHKEVAQYLNDRFITVKVDMETEDGIELASRYRVFGFPTFLAFAPDGSYALKTAGYTKDPEEFMAKVSRAFEESSRPMYPSKLQDRVALPKFYQRSFKNKDKNSKGEKPEPKEVELWLEGSNLYSEEAWSVMNYFEVPSRIEKHVIINRDSLTTLYGKEEVDGLLESFAQKRLKVALESKQVSDLDLAIEFLSRFMGEEAKKLEMLFRLRFSESIRDWNRYADQASNLIEMNGMKNHTGETNEYCWTLYLNTTDKELLNQAIVWMKEVTELEPEYMYLDTYAAVLYKAGHYDRALEWADAAIENGNQNEQNVDETVALRAKILKALGK